MNNTLNKKSKKFVVLRDGCRVSDMEYDCPSDAQPEVNYWNRLLSRWPDGTNVEVVEKQNKHRVYNIK